MDFAWNHVQLSYGIKELFGSTHGGFGAHEMLTRKRPMTPDRPGEVSVMWVYYNAKGNLIRMGRIIKDHQTLNAFTLSGAMNSELPGYFYMKIGLTLSSNYKQVKIGSSSFGICLYVF